MRKLALPFIICICFFFACKSNHSAISQDSVKNTSPANPNKQLIQLFKPVIGGVWVKTDYINKVVETKSPLAAMDLAGGITVINLKMDSVKDDGFVIPVGWGNHEGGEEILKFKPGKKNGTIQFGDFDLGYIINNGDTSLVLYGVDPETKTPTVTRYKKALNKEADLGVGLDFLINRGLITGKYQLTDSTGTHGDIEFTDRGAVTGLSNFKTYYIDNDLGGEPMNNLDGIIFDLRSKKQTDYTFIIKSDTLKLFNTRANSDSSELVVDKLVYKLVKVK